MAAVGSADVLVLGHGIAGNLVAAVANRAGARVRVVEQSAAEAVQAPQHAQLHNLLGRAQRELESLLPGILGSLHSYDGMRGRVAEDTHVHELGVTMPTVPLGRALWSVPRDGLVRALRSHPDAVRSPAAPGRVVGLELDGARCVGAWVETDAGIELLRSELIVDCLGANSPVRRRLAAAGIRVPVSKLAVRQWYATAEVRPRHPGDGFLLIFPFGEGTRGGLASPLPDGRYRVSLNGTVNDPVPRDAGDFRAYARTLPDAAIAELLADAGVDRPTVFAKPTSVWNRYDLAPVQGLISVGDASASLNPLFGQGVSGAAWEAGLVAAMLAEGGDGTEFARRSGILRQSMWDLMTLMSPDARHPVPAGVWDRIVERIGADRTAHGRYVDVWHLLEPLSTLWELAGESAPHDWGWMPEWL